MSKTMLLILLSLSTIVGWAQGPANLLILDEFNKPVPYYSIYDGKSIAIADSIGRSILSPSMVGKSLRLHTIYGDSSIFIRKDTTLIFSLGLKLDEILIEPTYKLSQNKNITVGENIFKSIDYGCLVNLPIEYGREYTFNNKIRIDRFSVKSFKKDESTQKPVIHIYAIEENGIFTPVKLQQSINARVQNKANRLSFDFTEEPVVLRPGSYFISIEFLPINSFTTNVKSYYITLTPAKTSQTRVRRYYSKRWEVEYDDDRQMDLVSSLSYREIIE